MNTLYEDNLQKLITLSEKIIKIYNELYNLEIDHKKNTDKYNKYLSYLNLLIELENEIYPNISNEDIGNFINIIKDADSNLKLSDFSLIINDKNNTYYLKRILNNLRLENNQRLIKQFEKENNNNMINSLILNNLILEDICNSFLFEIESSINKINSKSYQDSLKMIKYILSFLNKSIENKLKNNFNIPNKLYGIY